ncbi:hypothetical protein NC652_017134 [Populus alba x Populus x berolinensis]|nr:hypothetical protein NC652_017134 [Populus alba x Populus x berolinensis]
MFARALERGEVVGGGEAGLVTAGSGGSTISATSKAGVGELAGGCVSSGTVFSRLPASAGMMLYELSGMESEEHGFPARNQFAGYSVMIPSTPIPEVEAINGGHDGESWQKLCCMLGRSETWTTLKCRLIGSGLFEWIACQMWHCSRQC